MSTVAPAAEQAAPAEAPRPAPLPSRIVDVFFSPAQVFEQFRGADAPWLGATLVCALVSMAVGLLRPLFVTNREMAEMVIEQMRASGRAVPPGLTPDMLEKQMMIGTYAAPVISLVMAFLLVTVFAVALAALFSLMLGGRAPFRSYLAVASHASLVYMLGVVIVSGLMYATKRRDLTLSAALLVPGL